VLGHVPPGAVPTSPHDKDVVHALAQEAGPPLPVRWRPGVAPDVTVPQVGSQLDSPEGERLLAVLRATVSRLPEVEEVVDGFGHTTFKVGGRSFVIAGMGESGEAVSIKTDPVTQEVLVRHGPYYRTPYIGQHGWVSIAHPLNHDWVEVEELVVDGYRRTAPKRLLARLDLDRPGNG
jgi:predicted DNA-binding protein (MmcQ/YjbR family)